MPRIEAPPDLEFIKRGKLNMVCLREGKEIRRIDTESQEFLSNPALVRASGMDVVQFVPNAVFKITLDFQKPLACDVEGSVREETSWALCSCMGPMAHYNKVTERLELQQCRVCIQSKVHELEAPFHCTIAFDGEDEWYVEKIYR